MLQMIWKLYPDVNASFTLINRTKRVHLAEELSCPACGTELAGFDHADERTWRHLDTCQFRTILEADVPRVECPEHGIHQVRVPWAEPGWAEVVSSAEPRSEPACDSVRHIVPVQRPLTMFGR